MEPSDSSQISDGLKEQLQKADQAANDDKYDDCSNIKARCEAACLTRGGVVKNSCSVSDGTTYAKCECKSEFAYDTATPTETSTDTSTNGDVAETGGTDTNADGKADVYAAVKDAIHDSGLTSKLDSANSQLNNIGNKIDTVGSAINGLGSAVNGVGEGVNGLGTKLDTIAGKLDNLNNNTNQDITATGSADLPGHNSYDSSIGTIEEISLADTIGSFISNGLPIVSYFKGSYIDIGSASPAMSTEVFGKTITIDFSGMESILNSMGLVLVSVSTILSFMIIIRG